MSAAGFEISPTIASAMSRGAPASQAFREWRGYGITALALASGVPAGVIADHEAGRRKLTSAEFEAIGSALGVPCELLQPHGP